MTTSEHRLVHLDLKGAPPKLSYLEQVFPLFKKWGATGLLVEYEDTFPYQGQLSCLQAKFSYSAEDIAGLQTLASRNALDVIPLVQTFGHFEFVLKHAKFRHLREVEAYPMSLCPCKQDCMGVIREMIDQLVQAHPHIRFFHIGADEVYHLALCSACKTHMVEHNLSATDLFFMHVKKVLEYVRSTYPHLTCIMWDDMFRALTADVIKSSGIGDLVEPMVWYYQHTFTHLPQEMWDCYSQVFNNVWAASAFKGATGVCQYVTDICHHIENHKGWLVVEDKQIKPKFSTFRGYCITGWQRYDHYLTLCELLPVGLPSLAICLLILKTGAYTSDVMKSAEADLNFNTVIPLSPHASLGNVLECSFTGSDIYVGAHYMLRLEAECNAFTSQHRLGGCMTPYNAKHNYTNPAHVENLIPNGQRLLDELNKLRVQMSEALSRVFFEDIADEFITNVIQPHIDDVGKIVRTAREQVAFKAQPKQDMNCVEKMDSG